MKKLQCSLAAKIAAWVLEVVFLTAAGFSLVMVVFGWSGGVFERGTADFFDSGIVSGDAYRFGDYVATAYGEASQLQELEQLSLSNDCNYLYEIATEDGRVLSSTLQSGEDVAWEGTYWFADYDAWGNSEDQYQVTVAVKASLPDRGSNLYQSYLLFQFVEDNAGALVAMLIVSVVLALLLVVFLVASAGHKVRDGQRVLLPNWTDKIPFDLYTLVLGVAVILLLAVVAEWGFYGGDWLLQLLPPAAALLAAAQLALMWLLSLATRVKLGTWWQNTVVCRILRIVGRFLRAIGASLRTLVRSLPILWKLLGGTAVLLLVLFLLGLFSYESGFALLLDFLLCLAVLAAVGFAGLQMRTLQKGGEALAAGNLEARVDTSRMFWDLKRHGENLNAIGQGMAIAVEQRLKSERLKTELITNVSHDIKTPLTSILNYVDLLQQAETEEQRREYLAVLQRQAGRLKKLTEDLVEASKASTGNVSVNLVPTNVVESVNQALGEYAERLAAGGLTVVTDFPEESTTIQADGRLLWRVLDNLLGNVCKYALAGTRVYLTVTPEAATVEISLKNISRQQLNISAEELMERFVRGDSARTTEGSGLGLNIAKSLTELQGGSLQLSVDGDLFKAVLRFPKLS